MEPAPPLGPKTVKVDSVPQLIIPPEPRGFRIVFLIVKYIFIVTNLLAAAVSLYLLCSEDHGVKWDYTNALIILGLMFFIMLAIVALFGAIKEECYVVLTYDLFILAILGISLVNTWRPMGEELLFVSFVMLSFFFAYLLYKKHPIPST